jgi:hypothetical protein
MIHRRREDHKARYKAHISYTRSYRTSSGRAVNFDCLYSHQINRLTCFLPRSDVQIYTDSIANAPQDRTPKIQHRKIFAAVHRSHIRSFNALFLSPYIPSPNSPASFKRRTGDAISNSYSSYTGLNKNHDGDCIDRIAPCRRLSSGFLARC